MTEVQTTMVKTVVGQTISTYRLREEKLEEYLRKQFPTHDDFKIKVSR